MCEWMLMCVCSVVVKERMFVWRRVQTRMMILNIDRSEMPEWQSMKECMWEKSVGRYSEQRQRVCVRRVKEWTVDVN
jgi:hypothetical protein